jgi:hypothetical protein
MPDIVSGSRIEWFECLDIHCEVTWGIEITGQHLPEFERRRV